MQKTPAAGDRSAIHPRSTLQNPVLTSWRALPAAFRSAPVISLLYPPVTVHISGISKQTVEQRLDG